MRSAVLSRNASIFFAKPFSSLSRNSTVILPYQGRNCVASLTTHQSPEASKAASSNWKDKHKYFRSPVNPCPGPINNRYVSLRTHTCGELRASHAGKKVAIAGWIQYRRMGGRILVLRDGYGITQVILSEESVNLPDLNLDKLSLESVVGVQGTVSLRPKGQANPDMATGEIEVVVENFILLNPAIPQLPFAIRDFNKAKESLRMKYRYLDLRFPEMQARLRLRSAMLTEMRNFLSRDCGFVEVETPTLFRKTPGGAQEFVVPSRIAGRCYSLVQSPQQFKQLLMVGGMDRYFQIARCYRDETARPDRQPEFTQLDIEMSFSDQGNMMALAENLISQCWRATVQADFPRKPFPVMSYSHALNRYGTDKPDTRFGMLIHHLTEPIAPLVELCSPPLASALMSEDAIMGAVIIPEGQKVWSSSTSINKTLAEQKKLLIPSLEAPVCIRGLRVPADESAPWPNLGEAPEVAETLKFSLQPLTKPGDMLWLAAGSREETVSVLGRLRIQGADELEKVLDTSVRTSGPNFLWLVDFPLFVPADVPGGLSPAHHPFTQPHPEDMHLLLSDPLKVRALHYDLVVDGWEIAGGSVRIHNAELQLAVLRDLLQYDTQALQHLLDGLASGCPPHAGIAFGIDRLIAVACGAPSIRDVIAFPKAVGGRDPMSGAPFPMSEADQQLYHVKCELLESLPENKTL